MAYERVNWENLPSTKTPVNADNLNKLNDVIDEKVDSAISSIEIGGRNLARLAYIKEFKNTPNDKDTLNRDGYIFTGYAGAGAGIEFQKSDFNWELNQHYVLSFKFQNLTKDKDLTEIGGHSLAFRTEAIYINGKLIKNQWAAKNTIPASKGEQTCIVILQCTTLSGDDLNLYIQPQRGNYHSSNDLLIKFWDIKIERGNKATDWTPAPEDTFNALSDRLNKNELLQTIGQTTTNAMSQKSVTDELNKKANSSDVYTKNDFKNAGAHNSLYRGKDITSLFYNGTLSKQIAAGTFDDIFVGDFIIGKVSGRKYLVADLNYRLNTGDTECTTPHVLMIPEKIMGTAKMNDSNITTGAYVGSKMYTEYLTPFKTVINNDFGSGHILSHRQFLKNAVTNGYESAGAWKDSTIELMNELMVYGSNIFHNIQHGTNVPTNYTIDKSQLSLFRLKFKIIAKDDPGTRSSWWLRDVVSASNFAFVTSDGLAHSNGASNSFGVRPAFLIY